MAALRMPGYFVTQAPGARRSVAAPQRIKVDPLFNELATLKLRQEHRQ
jgi:hypothetical protein